MSQTLYKTMKDRTRIQRTNDIWQRMFEMRKNQAALLRAQGAKISKLTKWGKNWRARFVLSAVGMIAAVVVAVVK